MPTETKGWDITLVDVIMAGVRLDGWGENDAVKLTPQKDLATYTQGQDGEGVFSFAPNIPHELTITLRKTSRTNNIVSAFVALSSLFNRTNPIFPIIIIDRNTGSTYAGSRGTVTKYPEITFGEAVGDLTWTFVIADLSRQDIQLT